MADGALYITREQLAAALGGNQRAVRLVEALMLAVRDTLPESIDQVQLSALFSLHGADGSKSASNAATAAVVELETLTLACQRQNADLQVLRDQVDLLRHELHDTRARLSSAVAQAQADAQQALTLTSGV